jgi:hypothetical protein
LTANRSRRSGAAVMVQRETEFSFDRGTDLLVSIPLQHESSLPERKDAIPALAALDRIVPLLVRRGYRWGPGGSVGFEIATGVAAATSSIRYATVLAARQRSA